MENTNEAKPSNRSWIGVSAAISIGIAAYFFESVTKSPFADPILVAMLMGIVIGTLTGGNGTLKGGFRLAPKVFIPIGIVFYGAKNLNFNKLSELEPGMLWLLLAVMFFFFLIIVALGKLMDTKDQVTYLTATGSAICGASAIAVTAPAVNAEPDDISVSLLAVTIAAFLGLLVAFPFLATFFEINDKTYGVLAGTVLQFTGFVKVAVKEVPLLKTEMDANELMSLALSVKAVRYLALLVAIPLFSSLAKKKLHFPWFLWFFLAAGIFGTIAARNSGTFYEEILVPVITPAYTVLWAIAMAAVGLNANVGLLFKANGIKAIIMAVFGFLVATMVFFTGVFFVHAF